MRCSVIKIITAVARGNVIGFEGQIPWLLSSDRQRFRRLILSGGAVMLGRKTYEAGILPIPECRTMVISKTLRPEDHSGIEIYSTVPAAFDALGGEDCWVVGGASLFRECLPMTQKLYITRIAHDYNGDVTFPNFKNFRLKISFPQQEEGVEFNFEVWERIKKNPFGRNLN